jgi:hypothetical protein
MEQVQQDKKTIFPVIIQYITQVAAIAIAIKALTFSPAANIMVILPLVPVSLLTLVLFFIPLSKNTLLPGIGGGIILALFSYASIGQFITTSVTFVQPATDFIPKIAPLIIVTGIIVLVLTVCANRGEKKYSSFGSYALIGSIFIISLTTFFFFAFTKWLLVKYLIEAGNMIKMISFALIIGFSIYIGDHAMPRNKNYPIWPVVSVILVILYAMKMMGVKG